MVYAGFLLLLTASLYLGILYKSLAACTLFLFLLLLLLISLVQLVYCRFFVKAELPESFLSTSRQEPEPLTLRLINQGILPLPAIRAELVLLDQSAKPVDKKFVQTFLPPRSRRMLSFRFFSSYCGKFQVRIKELRPQSFLPGLSFTKAANTSAEVLFYPVFHSLPVDISEDIRYFYPETQDFEEISSGLSFIYGKDVRDFQPGDRLRQIHWKLSARTNALLVRSQGLPDGFSVLFFLELNLSSAKVSVRSSFYECAASLCFSLLEENCPHLLVWYDSQAQTLIRCPVRNPEELDYALYYLFNSAFYRETQDILSLYQQSYPCDIYGTALLLDGKLSLYRNNQLLAALSPNWLEQLGETQIII